MAGTAVLKPTDVLATATERAEPIPWYLWAGLLAATSAVVGVHWDISWHRSIGRDTFWTPAHIAIYFCGVLAGLSGAWVALSNTFGKAGARAAAMVRIWGFRAPLGVFLCIWGAVTMIASAPFDDWWHYAYGLDVKIISPPHTVLAIGLMMIELGAMLGVLGEMNRAAAARRRLLEWMYLYGAAMLFLTAQVFIMEYAFPNNQHSSQFFRVTAGVSSLMLAGVARACGKRWAATIVTGIYSLVLILFILILPLFPAEPKLGPVFHPVKFFIPPHFPLLLVFPALAVDWLVKRFEDLNRWALAAVAGTAFLLVYVAVQWPFADFMMTPAARNRFFGAHYMSYMVPPTSFVGRYLFFPPEPQRDFLVGMGWALVLAIASTRFSLGWGDWMRKIQR